MPASKKKTRRANSKRKYTRRGRPKGSKDKKKRKSRVKSRSKYRSSGFTSDRFYVGETMPFSRKDFCSMKGGSSCYKHKKKK